MTRSPLRLGALLMGALALTSHAAGTGVVEGRITLLTENGEPATEGVAVVYLEGVPAPRNAPKERPVIRQKDLAFEPELTVIQTGTSIEFPNEDKVFHNVFSLSRAARFDLGLYKSGASKTVTFNRPGTVDIFCNIHPQMVAKVKVVEGPYYAVTDKEGRFKIPNVPPGTWRIVAWQPYGPEVTAEVKVTPGTSTDFSATLKQGKRDRWHLRKDGTPYGRYK